MIKSLHLGNRTLPVNIIQGPLAGISNAPFRRLTWQHSQPAFSCTEMISCKTILHQPKIAAARFLQKDPQEGPLCFQLSGNNAAELADVTKRVTDFGADLIDLNCGCPVNKIRSKGAGSSLLTKPRELYQLIVAMKKNTSVPVSIKIRVQGQSSDDEKFNAEVVKVVSDSGADFLVVHGRHWTEHYETSCRHNEVQFFVENLKIPVIGNGDICDIDSLKKMFATGCAGVMLGRAGVGQPWLIRKLIAEMNHETYIPPANQEIAAIFLDHINDLVTLLGAEKFAILQARKLAKYYARELKHKAEFCEETNHCDNLKKLKEICQQYFL